MLHAVLGLSPDEDAAYRRLVAVPSTTAEELGELMAASSLDAARWLASLERQGLASLTSGETRRFVAAPPSLALGALLVKRQNEIKMAELELSSIEELYRVSSGQRGSAEVVDLVDGAAAIAQRLEQLQLGAREEVLAFVKEPTVVVSAAQNVAAEQAAVQRGVAYRVVLDRPTVAAPGSVDGITEALRAGEQIRVVDEVPLKLIIVDRALAFVLMAASSTHPSGPDRPREPGALVVRESSLLDALLALFESVWSRAIPLVTAADGLAESTPDALDELDARIIGLLLSGFTDQAVANQLALSLRTVQRRVRHLMDLARVETRMQLGWQASRLGWV